MRTRLILGAAAALLGAAAAGCTGSGGPPEPGPAACRPEGLLSIGEPLPDCSFRTFDGGVLELTSLRGKPAVLNFWASWCPPCIREMPEFDRVARDLSGTVRVVGFDLLGVDGEIEEAARRFARERGVTYELVFDPGGLLYAHFSVRTTLPTTIFVDAEGRIAHRRFGPLDEDTLRELVDEHLLP